MERNKPEKGTQRCANMNRVVTKDEACEDGSIQSTNGAGVIARVSSFKNGMQKKDLANWSKFQSALTADQSVP